MVALIGAVVAGALTTLAPCVLPLLPVIVGGAAGKTARRALVITGALGASIGVFTLLLKATTSLIDIPATAWAVLSGGILILLGAIGTFPSLWERVTSRLDVQGRTDARLRAARARGGVAGDLLTGAALGPVFSSCSPMYGYVVVTVLPASPARGLMLLAAYICGLCGTLLAIALAGRRLAARLGWAADTHGVFRRAVGVLFILVGLAIVLRWDKIAQEWLIVNLPFAPWTLDQSFIPAG